MQLWQWASLAFALLMVSSVVVPVVIGNNSYAYEGERQLEILEQLLNLASQDCPPERYASALNKADMRVSKIATTLQDAHALPLRMDVAQLALVNLDTKQVLEEFERDLFAVGCLDYRP